MNARKAVTDCSLGSAAAAGGNSFGYTSSSNVDSCRTASDKLACVSGATWHMFEDAYENSLTLGQLYQSTSSDNWGQWNVQKAVQRLDTVAQAKHGTLIPIP